MKPYRKQLILTICADSDEDMAFVLRDIAKHILSRLEVQTDNIDANTVQMQGDTYGTYDLILRDHYGEFESVSKLTKPPKEPEKTFWQRLFGG